MHRDRKTESRREVNRGWAGGGWGVCTEQGGVSVREDETSPGDRPRCRLHNTVCVLAVTDCALHMAKMVNVIILCMFHCNRKENFVLKNL